MNAFKKTTMLLLTEKSSHNYHFIKETFIFILLFFGSSFLTSFISIFLIGFLSPFLGGDIDLILETSIMPQWITILFLFMTVFVTIFIIIYCTKIEKRSLKSMGFNKKTMLKEYMLGFGIGALMILIAFIIAVLLGGFNITWNPSTISFGLILFFLMGFLLQGMSEEVLCRGYLMNTLTKRYSIIFAIMFNSIIFALLHLANSGISIIAISNLTLFGIFASVYMLRRGDIFGVCAIHSAWNFVQGNVLGISVSGMPVNESIIYATTTDVNTLISGGSFGLEGSIIVTSVLLISIFICYKMPQKDLGIN